MKFLKAVLCTAAFLFFSHITNAHNYQILFLGNSYVGVNDLPQIVADMAAAAGDSVTIDSYSPGNYTLQDQFNDGFTIAKIAQGNWDFVVLQEQSQLPSFPIGQVQTSVYPYAHKLDSVINLYNPCAETVFYMTWGRKNGDASNCSSWPPVCTYEGMDSLLDLRYRTMAFDNNAIVSPVGAVWKYIRSVYPLIELYQSDESHPSVEGSYAAACTFYATMLRKDPTLVPYDYYLDSTTASQIRLSAKLKVLNATTDWYIGAYDPKADYSYVNSGVNSVTFNNSSLNSSDYYWDFGDASNSTTPAPAHTYSAPGMYNVMLVSSDCIYSDTLTRTVNVVSTGIENNSQVEIKLYPNPASDHITIEIPDAVTGVCQAEIINSMGQKVYSGIYKNKDKISISTHAFARGFYLLTLKGEDNFSRNFPLILN